MDAQEEMQQIKQQITKQISKTLELGHLPSEEDLSEGGSCGSGCGCHH
jgi:DNA-binding GntR family transcriptional regulator